MTPDDENADNESFSVYIDEFRKHLDKGYIQKAYQGLIEYIMQLRRHFQKKFPTYRVSGSIYYGYMDMSYFAVIPEYLKPLKLKIAVVFVFETFQFEVWLSAANKKILKKYWNHIKDHNWTNYQVPSSLKNKDSILEHVLVEDPDFIDLDALTAKIEKGTLDFMENVLDFFSKSEK